MADEWQTAWVEVVPDFSEFRNRTNSTIVPILGDAGGKGGSAGSAAFGTALLGGISKLALPVAGVIATLGIGDAIGNAIRAGISYGFEGIQLGSDLAETKAAAEQIFRGASAAVVDFASTANTQLGQTQQQAIDAANTFGIFGKAAGLTGGDLSTFSTDLTTLATDLASFKNTDVDTAVTAIGAALRGENEPIRQFGVLLDDAALKQQALALGIYDGEGALTQQQRVLAATAALYAQTGDAQGDFLRTSDGLAGQQKILQASLSDTQTSLGEHLLPGFTTIVTSLNESVMPALGEFIDRIGPVLGDALETAAPAIASIIGNFAELLPILAPMIEDLLPGIVAAIGLTAAGFEVAAPFVKTFISVIGQIGAVVKAGFTAIGAFVAEVGRKTEEAVAFFVGLPGRILSALTGAGTWLINTGRDLVNGLIDGVRANVQRLIDAVLGPVNRVIDQVKRALGIASPSKVFADIGKNMALGLFSGFDSGIAGSALAIPGVTIPNPGIGRGLSVASMGASASRASFPDKVTLVDSSGSLLGIMDLKLNTRARNQELDRWAGDAWQSV